MERLKRRVQELERLVEHQAELLRDCAPRQVTVGRLTLDLVENRAILAGAELRLLPREFAILVVLARKAGSFFTADELRQAVWGDALHSSTNVIAVHLSRLRAKLVGTELRIVTLRGLGYCLEHGAPATT